MTRVRSIVAWAAAAAGIAIAVALGFWQLGRAHEREALQKAIFEQKTRPAQGNTAFVAIDNVANALYRPVRLQGRWIGDRTVHLDNRQIDGKPGFFVLTPLALEADGADASSATAERTVVMVQRGWAPRNFIDRAALPAIETPGGLVTVEGRIAPPPAKLYEAGADAAGPIRQNLDLAAYRAESGLALRTDLSVQQTGAASEGLRRDWPEPASGAARNYGYMVQWWALAVLIAVLHVRYQIVLPRRRRHDARA